MYAIRSYYGKQISAALIRSHRPQMLLGTNHSDAVISLEQTVKRALPGAKRLKRHVITSYSIHYTKLYDFVEFFNKRCIPAEIHRAVEQLIHRSHRRPLEGVVFLSSCG